MIRFIESNTHSTKLIFNLLFICLASFKTKAQRQWPTSPADPSLDQCELDGWVDILQNLNFDLGALPESQPQMAYVLRVRRGRQQTMHPSPTPTISEWMEFIFRGADNAGVYLVFSSFNFCHFIQLCP